MTSYLDLEERPVVVRQTFPADVTLPDGMQLRVARVVVTREAVYVWTTADAPSLVALHTDVDLAGTFDPPSRPNRVTIADGVVEWVPGEGCACSHPLKHFQAFAPTRLG